MPKDLLLVWPRDQTQAHRWNGLCPTGHSPPRVECKLVSSKTTTKTTTNALSYGLQQLPTISPYKWPLEPSRNPTRREWELESTKAKRPILALANSAESLWTKPKKMTKMMTMTTRRSHLVLRSFSIGGRQRLWLLLWLWLVVLVVHVACHLNRRLFLRLIG